MNRRSIFKILAGATLAAAIEVTGLVTPFRKVVTYAKVNPEYYLAAYEELFFWNAVKKEGRAEVYHTDAAKTREKEWRKKHDGIADSSGTELVPDPLRRRYNLVDGKYVEVPPYVTYEEEIPV